MIAEEKTTHLRVVAIGLAEGPSGAKFWASPTRAKQLIANGEAALVNAADPGPDLGVLKRGPDWPFDRFSYVSQGWLGDQAVVIGSGPSLTGEQIACVRRAREAGGVRVIAVNDAYLMTSWADILYAADSKWYSWHSNGIARDGIGLTAADVARSYREFQGQKCSIQATGSNVEDSSVHILRNRNHPDHGVGLSLDPRYIVTGRNSGFQALNLAVLTGASSIVLLGFDGRVAADGRTHFFGDHIVRETSAAYKEYQRAFSAAEHDIKRTNVRVINCSPGSEINAFEKRNIEEVL